MWVDLLTPKQCQLEIDVNDNDNNEAISERIYLVKYPYNLKCIYEFHVHKINQVFNINEANSVILNNTSAIASSQQQQQWALILN